MGNSNKQPLVSVIIPTWNREKTIKKAVLSALNQKLPPFEILVCDDGSTDNTYEIIKSIKDKKVKWIPGRHSGLPAVVRNRGIKESRGAWLAFLDSDDWWEKDKLEKQLNLVNKMQIKAVCTNAYVVNPHNDKKKKLYFSNKEVKDVIGFNELLKTNFIICSSMLVEKQLVLDCGGFPEEPALKAIEDYALWLRISTKTNIAYSDKPLVNYFDNLANSIRKVWNDARMQKKIVLQNFLKWSHKNFVHDRKLIIFIVKALMEHTKGVVTL